MSADGFSALAAHAPGLDLAMSPTATAAAVAELANVTRLAHIANSPHRAALIARPAEDREYYSENVADTLGDDDAEALGYGSDDPELSAAWATECEAAAREAEASE